MFVIITIQNGEVSGSGSINSWGEALDSIAQMITNIREQGVRVHPKGNYTYPRYIKGNRCGRSYTTSFSSAYGFTYIKKVEEGLTIEDILEDASDRAASRESRAEGSFKEDAYWGHSRTGRQPRSAEEAEEYRHCYNMGDFDY